MSWLGEEFLESPLVVEGRSHPQKSQSPTDGVGQKPTIHAEFLSPIRDVDHQRQIACFTTEGTKITEGKTRERTVKINMRIQFSDVVNDALVSYFSEFFEPSVVENIAIDIQSCGFRL
jgi:hypothetical protein